MRAKRADGDIADRVRDGNSSLFRSVLELLVTTLVRNFIPAIFSQALDDLTTTHGTLYTLLTHYPSWTSVREGLRQKTTAWIAVTELAQELRLGR